LNHVWQYRLFVVDTFFSAVGVGAGRRYD